MKKKFLIRFFMGGMMGSLAGHFASVAMFAKETHMWIYFAAMVILMVLHFVQWALEYKEKE